MELLMEHLGKGLMLSLLMSLPAVLMAAGIGLVVGILQAVTQVQEQTIAAAPKIIGVFAILLLGGGLMMNMMSDYIRESLQVAFNEIPQDGVFILPPSRNQTAGQSRAKYFFELQTQKNSADKLKEFATRWEMPEQGGSTTLLKVKQGGSAAGGLSTAEKMMLERPQKH